MSQEKLADRSLFGFKKHAGGRRRIWTSLTAVLIVELALSVSAVQNPQSNDPQTGARSAQVKPKRTTQRKNRKGTKSLLPGASREAGSAVIESLSPILATADFDLMGLAVTAAPASLTVPKNTPTFVQTSVRVPDGTDPSPIIAGLNPNYRVRGELTGP